MAEAVRRAGERALDHLQREGLQLTSLQQQLDTFRNLEFGSRSEKSTFDIPGQSDLFERDPMGAAVEKPKEDSRGARARASEEGLPEGCMNDEGLHFDDSTRCR